MRARVLLLAACGCGRLGFSDLPPAPPDAPPADATPGAPLLGCSGSRGPQIDLHDPALAGYWSFNERVNPVPDHSASGNVATFSGSGIAFDPGGLGAALKLDGEDGVATVSSAASLDVGAGDFTVELWGSVSDSCSSVKALVGRVSGSVGWAIACDVDGTALWGVSDASGSSTVRSPSPINDQVYHHIAGVRRAGQLELWIDGAMVASAPAGQIVPDAGDLLIGASLSADLDEVRLWREALDPTMFPRLAHSSRPGEIVYLDLDDDATGFAGMGNDGSAAGAAQLGVTGRAGHGAAFTGGELDVAMTDAFAADYTAMAWLRTSDAGHPQQVFDRADAGDPRAPIALWLTPSATNAMVASSDGTSVSASSLVSLMDGCWHHVAIVRVGGDAAAGEVRLYIDGQKVQDTAGTFGTTDDADPLVIGNAADNSAFAGTIDEVEVYDRALDDASIAEIYATLQ